MTGLAKTRNLRQLRRSCTLRRLHTKRGIPVKRNVAEISWRYGLPCLLATIIASTKIKSPSNFPFTTPVQLDAPSIWSSLSSVGLGGGQIRSKTTSAQDADNRVNQQHSGKPGEQKAPSQTRVAKGHSEEKDHVQADISAWQTIINKLSTSAPSPAAIGDSIIDYMVPNWVLVLPGFIRKLQNELSMAPGSLAEEIWHEANDPEINPEITWDASVRVSNDLCREEKAFLEKRANFTKAALARYLDIPEASINPEDIPIIAMCGSGGGLRALVAGTSSYLSSKEQGLFDCVTYTAGVSGSCWLQTLYYSDVTQQSHARMIQHLKNRLGVHIAFPRDALELLVSAPTNKYLLSGLVEKAKGTPEAEFGLVDIYGILLAARLLVPNGELSVSESDFKVSNQRRFTDDGSNPLPIYTTVRHEIPLAEQSDMRDALAAEAKARREAWFQWFEFTPYEMWCEELTAGIPTWAVGRQFSKGKTVWRDNGLALPEVRVPLLMGIWGSAFCATLSHYYKEIRPLLSTLTGFGSLDTMISERDEDLVKVHPIDPASIPNFTLGMREVLPSSCPESVHEQKNFQFMDAGMSNNLPIYPLLRPGRNVDILVAFDASADIRTDNWLKVVEGYARQRDIKGWPIGAGWPPSNETMEELLQDLDQAQVGTLQEAQDKMSEAQSRNIAAKKKPKKVDLGYCNVWVGSVEERTSEGEPPAGKLVEEDWELKNPNSGLTVVYFPFVANPKVPGVDPRTSEFMSTWNFVYTPEQIDSVVKLARTNFEEGAEQTKRTVRAVYERKRAQRESQEKEERDRRSRWKLSQGWIRGRRIGANDHGDQFS